MCNFSKVFLSKAVIACVSHDKWSNIMAIGGVGGNQPIENKPQVQSQDGIRRSDVAENQRSIFDKLDANHDGVLNEQGDSKGVMAKFKQMVANLTGANKKEDVTPTGTKEDVNAATNTPVKNEEITKFDKDGNVIPDIKHNRDGSSDTTFHGEKVHATNDSVDVKGQDGKHVGSTKVLPNGMQVLSQPDGKQGVYDPKQGEFLPENEAQKILSEMS